MEISALTLRVLLLFFPGVLCAMLVNNLTRQRDPSPARFLTNAFVLGMGSYLVLYAARELCEAVADLAGISPPRTLSFFVALTDERQRIAWGEIALAAIVAVPLAVTVAAFVNQRLFMNAARKIKVARGFGEYDVWALLFNSPDVGWLVVRDLANDLTFTGTVEAFSDTGERPELLLRDVTVHRNSSGTKLYETRRVYLSRPGESLVLEPGPGRGGAVLITSPGVEHGEDQHPSAADREVQQGRDQLDPGKSASGLPAGADGNPVPDTGS